MQFRSILAGAFIALGLASCSDSGSSSASPPQPSPRGSRLLVETSAGEVEVTARVVGLALEDATRSVGPNLIETSGELTLADPLGRPSGLAIRAPAPGVYVALHVIVAPDSARGRVGADALERVHLPSVDLRVPFADPLVYAGRAPLIMRHAVVASLQRQKNGDLSWRPELIADVDHGYVVRGARVRILAIDGPGIAALGVFERVPGVTSRFEFVDADRLRWNDDDDLTPAEFVARLETGTRLLIDGVLDIHQVVRVVSAERIDDDRPRIGGGNKSEVHGAIRSLDRHTGSFELDIARIRKAGRGWPQPSPRSLRVRVGDKSMIKWVRRRGKHRGHLPFGALRVGMFVEVEWHGPVVGGAVTAHKVDIKFQGRHCVRVPLRGRVRVVDTTRDELVLGPVTGDRMWVGDRLVAQVVVAVPPDGLIARERDGLRLVELADLRPGDVVYALACPVDPDRVSASLVVARTPQ